MKLRRALGAVATFVATTMSLVGYAQGQQIGAASQDSGYAQGVQSLLTEPSQFINGNFARVYWVGVTFPDGIFYQAGFEDAPAQWTDQCQSGFSTFETGLYPNNGGSVFSNLYNNANCNITGNHFVALRRTASGDNSVTWRYNVGNFSAGPALGLPGDQYKFAKTQAGVITEIVDTQPVNNYNVGT